MNKKIEVSGSSEAGQVPVRRRNTQGVQSVPMNITLPKELSQTINAIVSDTHKSRSRVIAELIQKGLDNE